MDVQNAPESPYIRARNKVLQIINMRIYKAWLSPDCVFNLTAYAKEQKEGIEITHEFADKVPTILYVTLHRYLPNDNLIFCYYEEKKQYLKLKNLCLATRRSRDRDEFLDDR